MVERAAHIEAINSKIASLRMEISQSGALGLTNIHKHCENLMRDFLNTIYGFNLKSLNETSNNFPGLDIGDESEALAYQVSSDSTSEKVNDMLEKCIKYKHYEKFSSIRLFVLSKKQGSYTLKITTKPSFEFDPGSDIIDFDDVLREIGNMNLANLKRLHTFLDEELPEAIKLIKEDATPKLSSKSTMIDIGSGLQHTGWKHFYHWRSRILLPNDVQISAPSIYKKLSHAKDNQVWKESFFTLAPQYRRTTTSNEVQFHENIRNMPPAINPKRESVVRFRENLIEHELALYNNHEPILSNLFSELGFMLGAIFACPVMCQKEECQVEVQIEITSNCQMIFQPHTILLEHPQPMVAFYLNPRDFTLKRKVSCSDNSSIFSLLESILHGFVAAETNWFQTSPYFTLNEDAQKTKLNTLRGWL